MLSVVIPIRFPYPDFGTLLQRYESQLLPAIHRYWNRAYEIILVPNPMPEGQSGPMIQAIQSHPTLKGVVRMCESASHAGKGQAIREGIKMAQGDWVCLCDADLPFDLDFIQKAQKHAEKGAEFVTANRRLLESEFRVSVGALSMVYRRHLLGLIFNRVVRFCLPIASSDTQAGMKWMSRKLAKLFATHQQCPGFFFDLELFLLAQTHRMPTAEVPVVFTIRHEKSTVRVFREGLSGIYWLFRIMKNARRGIYHGSQ